MRVLVVQDQTPTASGWLKELTNAGHELIGPARTSRDALQLAKTRDPDIAFVDLDAEGQALGLELTESLTADEHLDVIVCTEQPDIARRSQSGAMGLLSKPCSPQDVIASISIVAAMKDGERSSTLPPSFELLVSPQ
jgi:two-component system, response regulator PdtaR